MKKNTLKGYLYVTVPFILTAILTYIMAGMVVFKRESLVFVIFWLAGYCVLVFNVCLLVTQSVFYVFLKKKLLPEFRPVTNPPTAVVYPVKEETFGLYERIRYTVENNRGENVHFWILSDSKGPALKYEEDVLSRLKSEYGDTVIKYRNRVDPVEKKHGNISDWIEKEGNGYKYMLVCDADSVLPAGAVQKFIDKAEHPDNADIAIFQGSIGVIHAKTFFSKFISLATESSQKFNVTLVWRIFDRATSVGHGNLIRIEPFSKVKLRKGTICHDICETVYLDIMGYRTAYCEDITSYEEVPANYLEAKQRDSRWARGTLQAWYLLFLKDASLASRYYVGYALYSYGSHPLFLLWLIAGFFCSSSMGGNLLTFQRYAFLGYSMIDLELSTMLIGTLMVVAFYKAVACRSFKDLADLLLELLFSTLICLNNIFYVSVDILLMPFRELKWKPMKKDPFAELTLKEAAISLIPGTVFGLVCVFLGLFYSRNWLIISSPFVISFIGAIPGAYLTGMRRE